MTYYPAILQLNRLRLCVHLGVPEDERAQPQTVEVDIHFFLPALPECAENDHSEQYICYGTLSDALIRFVKGKSFHLIEYLTHQLYIQTREYLAECFDADRAQAIKIRVRLHKIAPPVPALSGGASFIYSDLPQAENG